jgi:hypothetical protein
VKPRLHKSQTQPFSFSALTAIANDSLGLTNIEFPLFPSEFHPELTK